MYRLQIGCLAIAVVCSGVQLRVLGQEPHGPSYEIDLSDAINHYATVAMVVEPTGDETQIMNGTA